ncbi:uncharacterized protein LOC141641765 [Silene latifolia]|uniref:uncharacterized protein LOC141641765 n=1 Tax=Silene latifolia TaxID=37657 RepID=UPI003D77337C
MRSEEDDYALVTGRVTHHTDVWILDSGASYHICPRREWFTTYEQVDGGTISMANSAVCRIVGIGSVRVRTHDGKFCTLNEVRHVPLMSKNLIFLSTLDSKGFSFQGVGGVLNVCKDVDKEDLTKLWHMRLGHMSERGMQTLSKEDLLCGHKVKNMDFCEHCVFGKLHRSKFPKAVHRTKGTLDYIQSDCWGPSKVKSLGGHRAFGSTAYYHVSEGKLEPRAKKGVFVGYGDGVKGYRIWSPSEGRIILSRNVVFDENSMVNPTVKSYMLSDSSSSVDKQVEQQDTLDESVPQEEDQPLQFESESVPSDSSLPVPNQQSLARERSIRPNFGKPPNRLGFEDMVGYALQVAEEVDPDLHEPSTFKEAATCSESAQWLAAMGDEMESLQKNQNYPRSLISA